MTGMGVGLFQREERERAPAFQPLRQGAEPQIEAAVNRGETMSFRTTTSWLTMMDWES